MAIEETSTLSLPINSVILFKSVVVVTTFIFAALTAEVPIQAEKDEYNFQFHFFIYN